MQITDYVHDLTEQQASVVLCLHDLICENPAIELKRRWNLPFYYRRSWICYFNILKDGNVEWAFTRGNELSNGNGWLEDRGRKQIYSVNFQSISDIDISLAKATLQEALLLDEHVPYSVKKGSSN